LFVLCTLGELISTKSVPQEKQRLQIPHTFLHRPVPNPKEYIQGSATKQAFNLDKVGILGWEDRETSNILFPAVRSGQKIHHGIRRNVEHISAIACISTPQKSLISYEIMLQDFDSV
jgi:hypothetical protein